MGDGFSFKYFGESFDIDFLELCEQVLPLPSLRLPVIPVRLIRILSFNEAQFEVIKT